MSDDTVREGEFVRSLERGLSVILAFNAERRHTSSGTPAAALQQRHTEQRHTSRGTPNSGIPNGGIPNSGIPNSGIPNGGIPNSGIPNSGTPAAAL